MMTLPGTAVPNARRSCEGRGPVSLCLILSLTLTSPTLKAAAKARTPGGRPPWMAAVFRSSQGMASRKMPTQLHARASGLSGRVLSFGYFSLHQQRKVTRRQAKAFDFCHGSAAAAVGGKHQSQHRFALSREFISFAGPKETNQRKGPSPTNLNSDREAGRHFPTRHSLARSENGAHPCAPPSGCADMTGYSSWSKVKVKVKVKGGAGVAA
jgi:hypothetical protein